MRQFVQRNEQYLFQIVADLLKQKTELEKLRVAVRLAEVAQALQLEELRRRPINSKVFDLFAGPHCASSEFGRLPRKAATSRCSKDNSSDCGQSIAGPLRTRGHGHGPIHLPLGHRSPRRTAVAIPCEPQGALFQLTIPAT
jgi:hypothetical protein